MRDRGHPVKCEMPRRNLLRDFRQQVGALAHLCGALDLVPVEGLAVDGALERFEEHDGEYLAVGKALQPDMEEQPAVAFVGGVTTLERECRRRGDEVDDEETEEVNHELFEAGRRGCFRMVMAVEQE